MSRPGSDFNRINNTTGEVVFDTTDERGNRIAVLINRIFPAPKFRRGHYIGLQMSGKLDGSINVSAPACYNVRCGEQPVNGVSAITYAENGDIILFAPRGRVRIMAKDIDLIAEGNGADTGLVRMVASDAIGIAAERNVNINSGQRVKVEAGSFKVSESPDVSPITSFAGSGSLSPIQYAETLKKLLQSIL